MNKPQEQILMLMLMDLVDKNLLTMEEAENHNIVITTNKVNKDTALTLEAVTLVPAQLTLIILYSVLAICPIA